MTETRFAMTSSDAAERLPHSHIRALDRRSLCTSYLCILWLLCLLCVPDATGTACRALRAKSVHKPRIFARQPHQKKCHTVQSNFPRISHKTNDGHPKEVTHKSGGQCTGISAVGRRPRREFSTFDFPISLFRLPETNRRFLRGSHYCAPRPAPHAVHRICALRCYKDGEEIPL